ncbi:hypothetical protein [Halovivax gelatinilyticus]|uniref:hypothetical protein n=1 Tax=Halovivax gelatinilyticus TaxID=2961597 RepID=UPI0020CA5616|nr:hypothetical protein [Halovivax gelatinilyticus]
MSNAHFGLDETAFSGLVVGTLVVAFVTYAASGATGLSAVVEMLIAAGVAALAFAIGLRLFDRRRAES